MSEWSKEEIEILKVNYGKMTKKELLKLLPNQTFNSLKYKSNVLNLRVRKLGIRKLKSWDESFFEIPNEINSYWAGFLAADGYLNFVLNSLSLYQSDINVIKAFKKAVNCPYKIMTRKRTLKATNREKVYTENSIQIYSKKIINDLLINFNLTQNKSLTLKPPINLNYKCSLSYIIGLIDGDGSLNFIKNSGKIYPRLSIAGTLEVLEWVSKIINNFPNIRKRKSIYIYETACAKGEKSIKLLLNHKSIKNIRLKRKWDQFKNWKFKC